MFKAGAVDSSVIQSIQPDWHRIMGWNATHRLNTNDYAELDTKRVMFRARQAQSIAQEKVNYLISTKQHHLIGKGVPIKELERPSVDRREGQLRSVSDLLPPRA